MLIKKEKQKLLIIQ